VVLSGRHDIQNKSGCLNRYVRFLLTPRKLLPDGRYNVISFIMPPAIEKPRRAKKGSGPGLVVGVRMRAPELKALDDWALRHRAWSRPEAIRNILTSVLNGARSKRASSANESSRAVTKAAQFNGRSELD
jgi:hypothetical protein